MRLIILLLFSVSITSGIEIRTDKQEPQYFILHYTPGPEWDFSISPTGQTWFAEHSQFLTSLRDSERAIIGGRYSDKGMIILKARDRTEADSLLGLDPSVANGLFTAEMHEIRFFYHGTIPDPNHSSRMDH